MSPTAFLLLMTLVTVGAAGASMLAESRRRAALRRLAGAWQMHYTAYDRFRLAPRVAPRLPAVGAAAVRVKDLIYGLEGDRLRYIFAAQYTTGTMATPTRRESVATFSEPREGRGDAPVQVDLLLAPSDLPLVEQYEYLRKRVGKLES